MPDTLRYIEKYIEYRYDYDFPHIEAQNLAREATARQATGRAPKPLAKDYNLTMYTPKVIYGIDSPWTAFIENTNKQR
eukprot:SAG31_NODE_751_length_12354_cov_14.018605_7_plen_78_part_00